MGLMLLAVLLLVTAACSDSSSESSGDNEGSEEGSDGTFSFSMMANLHTPEVPDEKVLNKIEEVTSTDIEIQWVPDNNYEDRLNTAFATNSLPDAVFLKNQATFIQFREAIQDGQFWEVGQYLDEFENLSKLKQNVLDNTKIDGELYTLYQGRPLSRQGIIYRKDWAENLGLEAPTTTDEFMEMVRAFTEDDPDGNGKDDTFGLTDRSDLIYGAFKTVSSWFGTPNYWGGEKDGQLLPEFMFDEYVQTMDFFKEMHENGYINQDFPVTSKPDQQEFIKNGTAGVYVGAMSDVGSLHDDAIAINPDAQFDVHNYVEGPSGEFGVWSIPGYGNLVMFPKSSVESEEELKKILGFFDQMMSPEVANYAYWGFEGEHYELVDGAAKVLDSDKNEREVKPYQAIEIGEPETNGRYLGYFDYEPKAKSEELFLENEEHLINDPTVPLYSETYVKEGGTLQQIITDATYNYILGQIDKDGFDKAIEEWKSQGGDKIIEEYNASYEESK